MAARDGTRVQGFSAREGEVCVQHADGVLEEWTMHYIPSSSKNAAALASRNLFRAFFVFRFFQFCLVLACKKHVAWSQSFSHSEPQTWGPPPHRRPPSWFCRQKSFSSASSSPSSPAPLPPWMRNMAMLSFPLTRQSTSAHGACNIHLKELPVIQNDVMVAARFINMW